MNDTWVRAGEAAITADPARIAELFPAAGREAGRGPIDPDADPHGYRHGTVDDLARERFVVALARTLPADGAAAELAELYRYGDDAEQRGVLRGLGAAELTGLVGLAGLAADGTAPATAGAPGPLVETGLRLVAEALRTNDPRLVAAALGPFAAEHLDQHTWRHGVLKALFMGIPLDVVAALDRRADAELARMAAGLVAERRAAGRAVTDDMTRLAAAGPQED
ncbi:EboA domain-containing protein [Agromyces sp. NPDC058126]|uniref:EboA domain-containing protein n=1 Tax=Agromyces sp. NPDC058126 TaxID=3346350 RepID=UPI0036D8C839